MKKYILLMCCVFASMLGNAQADVIYDHTFDSDTSLDGWTVIDNNNDGSTWTYNSSDVAARYTYNSYNDGDDWLISPSVDFAESGYYKVSFVYQGTSYGERMSVFVGNDANIDAMTTEVVDLGTFYNDTDMSSESLVYISESGQKHIGFYAYSAAGMYKILLKSVSISKAKGIDASVTDITSPVTGWYLSDETVTVNIKNNGKDPITGFKVSYSVNDENTVEETYTGTLASGESAEYSFDTKVDLSSPRAVYEIKAWVTVADDDIPDNDACTVSVKNYSEAVAPYYTSFEDPEENELMKFFNLNEDDGYWSVEKNGGWSMFSRTGDYCIMYTYDKENDGDDWAITEPIKLDPGYYSFKFWYATMGEYNERMEVYYGTEQTVEAMKNKIVSLDPFLSETYSESASVIHIEEAGKYYFGFHAFSEKDMNLIVVDDLSIEPIAGDMVDPAIVAVSSPEHGFVRDIQTKDLVFAVSNLGIKDVEDVSVKAWIDDSSVLDETVSLTAQQTLKREVKDALNLADGTYTLRIEVAHDSDANNENNVIETQFTVVSNPVRMWDFEDGNLPSDMHFVNGDGMMIHSSIEDLISDKNGWGLVELSATEGSPYGSYMLGLASYLEDNTRADKWCVLPKVKVNSANAYLVWTANSMDEDYPETYEVAVTANEVDFDNFYSWLFSVKETVPQESPATAPATRGLSLAEYAGQEIYVAFHLNTKAGFVLTVDNIGLYGDLSTGIDSASGMSDVRLVLDGDLLSVVNAQDVASVQLFDSTGMEVVRVKDSSNVNISGLAKGVYVAVVSADGKTFKLKFVK